MGRVSQEKRRRKRKSQKEDLGARKGKKFAKNCVFPMICGSGGSKSRLAKAAGAEPAGEMRDEKLHATAAHVQVKMHKTLQLRSTFEVVMSKKCTPLWREAHFEVKMYKAHQVRPLLEVEMSKKCTPLWREAHFEVKMYKAHTGSDHFWKLRCRKSARRCGAKHISKSLFEVEMSKKCTPLRRTTFGRSDVVLRGRRKGLCTLSKVSKT